MRMPSSRVRLNTTMTNSQAWKADNPFCFFGNGPPHIGRYEIHVESANPRANARM